jgi:uncharacterized peroxidase-related enzyme
MVSYLSTVSEGCAAGDVKRVYEEIKREKRLPFVPNFFKTLAHAPQVLDATWMVYRGISTRGSLPEALKEMIFVAISVARDCKYCEAAHLAFCSLLGVEPGTLSALTEHIEALRPERTKDIVRFSVKCALQPRSIEQSDYESLRQHGITDGEIIETIAMCGFAMYATTIADVLQLDTDREALNILSPQRAAVS